MVWDRVCRKRQFYHARPCPRRSPRRAMRDAILFVRFTREQFVLKLLATTTSPYGRKVRIALAEKKFEYQLERAVAVDAGQPRHGVQSARQGARARPRRRQHLYDSRVIVEYLDTVSPVSRLIPEPSRQRIAVKRWEALADGLCDAAIAIVLEGKRPLRQQSKEWIARQRQEGRGGRGRAFARARRQAVVQRRVVHARRHRRRVRARLSRVPRGRSSASRTTSANLTKLAEKLGKRPTFSETAPRA